MHTRPSRNMPRKRTMWPSLVTWFLLSTGLFWPSGAAAQSTSRSDPSVDSWKPRVLVLHSYHHGFTWSDNISSGIRSVFKEQAEDVELRFEFMDTRRVHTEAYFQEFKELLDIKYAGTPIDVIIASDDHAYNFMMGLGQDVFPNVPVVFCSVTGYEPSVRQSRQLTGLQESIDIKATLDVALELHPRTREVAVITDMTRTGRALKAKAKKVFSDYESRLDFSYLEDLTIEDMKHRVAGLSDETIAFLFIFSRDKAGRVFSHEHNLRILARHCNVPIYAVWEFYLGHGIVGGMLTSGEAEGRMAAEMALRILGGENASDISLGKSPTQYMFDYRQLERFNIKEGTLPEDSRVINKPFSFHEDYRPLIWSGASAIALLILVVAMLGGHILFRRRAEQALRQSEERYRDLVENVNDVIYAADEKGVMTYISPVVESVTGYNPLEVIGKSFVEFVYDEDRTRVVERFQDLLSGAVEPMEYRLVAKSGEILWVRSSSGRVVEGGRVTGLRGVFRDVTKRKLAEEALRQSEERYRSLFRNNHAVMLLIDPETGQIVDANPAASSFYGYSIEELRTKKMLDINLLSQEEVLQEMERARREQRDHFYFQHRLATGDVREVEVFSGPINVHGKSLLYSIIHDITDRKKAEEALRVSKERYRGVYDTAPLAFVVWDRQCRVTGWNDRAKALFGWSREEVLGRNFFEFLIPEVARPRVEDVVEKLLLGQIEFDIVNENLTKSGDVILCRWNNAVLRDGEGQVAGAMSLGLDITEEQQAQEALRQSEQRFQEVAENSEEWIWEVDTHGLYTYASPVVEKILGHKPEDIVGKKHFYDLFCPEEREQNKKAALEVFAKKESFREFINANIHKNGDIVWLSTSGVPILDKEGNLVGYRGADTDITDRRRAEGALKVSEEFNKGIIESSYDCIKVLDLEGRLQFMSRGGQRLLEIDDVTAYLNKSWVDFWEGPDRVAALDAIEKAKRGGRGLFRGSSPTALGQPKWWDVVITPIRGADGNVEQLLSISRDITGHKEAEEALRGSEEKYRQLVEHAPSAIYEIDFKEGRFISFNDVLSTYTGYTERDLMEINPLDLFTDDSKEVFRERLGLMSEGEEVPPSQEYEIRRKDGTTMWALININYEMEAGVPARGRMVAHDITERKSMESAVKESEEKYRTLYDSAADVIIVADSEGNLLDVNRMFEEESGFSRDEMLGKNLFTSGIMTEASIARALSAFNRLLDGKEWQHLEVDGETKDGHVIPFEVRAVPIMREGELQGIQAILRNIRERKEAEEVLRTEKEKFEILVEESPLAVSLIGQDGGYRYINPEFVEIFGYTLEDVPNGQAWFPRAYPDPAYRHEVISAWIGDMSTSKTGESRPRVFDVTCKDGSEKVIHFRPVTMHNGDQLVIYEDISEQRRLERRLRQAQKMEAIGTLAGGIAHDFNNILTPIMVQTEVAMQQLPKQNPVQHNLEEVTRAAHRAKDLVKQILTFGRESEQQRMPLRVGPVLKETMKLLRSSLPTTIEVRLSINVASDVALTDPTEIHQVLMNLCTNAAHAMGDKGGVLEVRLEDVDVGPEDAGRWPDQKPGSYLRLSVSDTGDGMDQATMERIFDPFFTTKSREEGTGMGLAVVHGIVKSYGGGMSVESETGRGTTFHVFLPRDERDVEVRTEPAGPVPTGNERILLVDDEGSVADTVRLMLEHLGYEVAAKVSSVDALEAFQAEPDTFDLVITDQTMPKMTGKELAQRLLSIRPQIPVILFTGFGHGITEQEAKAVGISAYLMKPLDVNDMARTIRKVIDKARRHKKVV